MTNISVKPRPVWARRSARAVGWAALLLGMAACGDDPRRAEDPSAEDPSAEDPSAEDPSASLAQQGRDLLEAHRAQREFPGAVMALHDPARGDALVTSGATRPTPEGEPVDPDVPWGIGSITKTFVAVVVLQLAEEGTLDLDASVEAYFPELPRASEITVRQLLQHTSGLNEYFASPAVQADMGRPWSPDQLVDAAVALGPVSEPGAEHHYANTNYILLGELVGALDGRPWHEAVRGRILEPLGMQHTYYIGQPSALPLGPGHGLEEGQFVDHTGRVDPSLGGAAGGLESTAPDLMRFARALLEGRLLDEPSWTQMQAFVPAEPHGYVSHEYGLGFEKYIAGELAVYGHLGTSAAHAAFFGFDPQSGAVAAVLINADESPPPALMAFEALGALAGKDVSPPGDPAP